MTRRSRAFVAIGVATFLSGCPMDREEVLKDKRCDQNGNCAFGYRCQSGTCVLDTMGTRRNALQEKDASDAPAPSSGSIE